MGEYIKEFDEWNRVKKVIDWVPILIPCEEKEIWRVSMGINVGSEIDGKGLDYIRPVVIIRKSSNESLLVIPLSHIKNPKPYIHVSIVSGSLEPPSFAVLNQIKNISNKRLVEKVRELDKYQFDLLVDNIVEFIRGKSNKT